MNNALMASRKNKRSESIRAIAKSIVSDQYPIKGRINTSDSLN